MAMIAFKKGSVANLPSTYSEGTFYVTTDERALYLDISNSARIRLGDYQEYNTLEDLGANNNPSTTALYYVRELNCLAKWNGTSYVQINKDSGMTSIEVTGSGNAVTASAYDEIGRKLTLTKGATFATCDYIGEIPSGYTETTIVSYINKKADEALQAASGGSSESAASVLAALNTYKTTNDARVAAIEEKEDDWDAAEGNAKSYADTKDNAIKSTIGTVPNGKTVVGMISEAQAAATYDDTALAGRVTAAEGAITTLNGTGAGSVAKAVADAIASVVAGANTSFDTLKEIADWILNDTTGAAGMANDIDALEALVGSVAVATQISNAITAALKVSGVDKYALATSLTDLAGRVNTIEGDTHTHGNRALLDTYTQTNSNLADAVNKTHSHSNSTELNKIASGDKVKWDAAEQKAHTHDNKSVLDGITSEKVLGWDTAETNAKSYTDFSLAWGEF